MQILSTNSNFNFQSRIRVSKPINTKIIAGTTTLSAGVASLYTGSDALNIIPNSGLVKDICQNINNEEIVQTEKGLVAVNNETEALLSGMAMAASLPIGSTITPIGSNLLNKASNKEFTSDKKIPN